MLGPDFEADRDALRREARRQGSWNIYYLPVFTKIDVFFLRSGPFDRAEFGRRSRVEAAPGLSLFVKTPEDSVLRKLLWFRAGGETSERQLRDVVAVLKLNAGRLDEEYLDSWGARLGIEDLLDRVRQV